ncbi:MAG: adenylate kinase [Chloroflexi bacterium HGW-Chloroflexi-10]|nr:MAG: adenylate kinase [Chloroflexi bacterium HGW-Chloroflexi-10]
MHTNNPRTTQFPPPGQRIAIIGATGSGKTTLSQQLAERLGIPCIELDSLHWLKDWQELALDEFRRQVQRSTAQPAWVTDGNYTKVRDIIWQRADTLVWLDYPFHIVFGRLFRRTMQRVFRRTELWNGNREDIRITFFSTDSLFVWLVKSYPKHKRTYPALLQEPENQHLTVLRFTHPRQTRQWLQNIPRIPTLVE